MRAGDQDRDHRRRLRRRGRRGQDPQQPAVRAPPAPPRRGRRVRLGALRDPQGRVGRRHPHQRGGRRARALEAPTPADDRVRAWRHLHARHLALPAARPARARSAWCSWTSARTVRPTSRTATSSTIENLAADLHAVDRGLHRRAGRAGRPLDGRHDDHAARRRPSRDVRRPGGRGDAAQHQQPPAPRVVARRAAHRPVRPPCRSARRLGQGLQQLLRRAPLGAGAERPGAARRHDERDDPAAPPRGCSPTSTRCSPRSTCGMRWRRCRTSRPSSWPARTTPSPR